MSNLILTTLPQHERLLLEPHLKTVNLPQQHILFDQGDTIASAYFPLDAVVSLVVTLSTGETIEAAMVGRDGIVGAAAALDGRISLSRAIVQIGGRALSCDVTMLKKAALESAPLLSLLARHEQTVYAQAQQSAACNIAHNVNSRLCRWLLRARDLAQNDMLPLTQEFLSEMLGVRRSSVSLVAHTLQQAGMIKYARGKIQIINLDGLQETACECYSTIKGHYDAFLAHPHTEFGRN